MTEARARLRPPEDPGGGHRPPPQGGSRAQGPRCCGGPSCNLDFGVTPATGSGLPETRGWRWLVAGCQGAAPARTHLHRHACASTHGQMQTATPSVHVSTLPPAPLFPRPPDFQARSSHTVSHPGTSLPCPGPGPQPHLAAAVPPQGGLAGWGPAAVGGQWRLAPLHQPSTGQCQARGPRSVHSWPQEARPRVRCSTDTWVPRNAFGKDLFLNTKNAPPASCGNSTFCSPHSGLHVCRLLSVRLSVYLLRPIPGETRWEKGG